MKSEKYLSFILLTFILTACNSSTSKNKLTSNDQSQIVEEISSFLDKTGIPSVSYVIINNGKIKEANAIGFSNMAKQIPVDINTYFNTGSNFKSVTSTAIMQLHEKGLLDIDAPINKYLKTPIKNINPENPITARHLLSHQAGIQTSVILEKVWAFDKTPTFDEVIDQLFLFDEPGRHYQYANDGFVIAGKLIEDLTDITYHEYIWENILKPLEIDTRGFIVPSPEMVENLALPYHMRYNKAYPTHQLKLPQYPCGSVYLTPMAMAKFLLMHLNNGVFGNNTLLQASSVGEMHKSSTIISNNFHYGLGFGRERIGDKMYSFHQGSLPGYLSAFRMDFDSKSAVYIATNVSAAGLQEQQMQVLLNYLMDYCLGQPLESMQIPVEPKSIFVENGREMDLTAYEGKYIIEGSSVFFTIQAIGNSLFLFNPAGDLFKLEKLETNHFFLTTENEDVIFMEQEHQITKLEFISGDNKIMADKEN